MTQAKSPIELSVVVPAFNESEGITDFIKKLNEALINCCTHYEICVIDDGSRDATWDILRKLSVTQVNLVGLRLTRNFGKEAAILAGLRCVSGKAIVVIDSDGQHPVDVIPKMLALWRSGSALIVSGVKADRGGESIFYRLHSKLFNAAMRILTGLDLARASDFKLLDRRVVESILCMPEKVRFFRGITAWTGFARMDISFDVAPRLAGRSAWSYGRLVKLAVSAITAFTSRPLGMVIVIGCSGLVMAALLLIQAFISWLNGTAVTGWTSLTFVVVLFGSLNLLGLGVIGAYIGQLFHEVKGRPEYLVSDSIGVLAQKESSHIDA